VILVHHPLGPFNVRLAKATAGVTAVIVVAILRGACARAAPTIAVAAGWFFWLAIRCGPSGRTSPDRSSHPRRFRSPVYLSQTARSNRTSRRLSWSSGSRSGAFGLAVANPGVQ
jgi:hypothetical protein